MILKIFVYYLITAGVYWFMHRDTFEFTKELWGPAGIGLAIAIGITLIHMGIAFILNKIVNAHGDTKDWTSGTVSYGEDKIYTKDPFGGKREEKTQDSITDVSQEDKVL